MISSIILLALVLSSSASAASVKSHTAEEPVCFVRGQCQGVLLGTDDLPSASACLQSCSSTEGCLWFTFHVGTAKCLYFDSCPSIDESCTECLSGESRCTEVSTTTHPPYTTPSPTGFTKIFVGLDFDSYAVEVVNLDGTGQICGDLPHYPFAKFGSTGQLFNGSKPMICGGVIDGEEFGEEENSCKCNAIDPQYPQFWATVSPLKTCRRSASAVSLSDDSGKEVMVMAGGIGGEKDDVIDSVEVFDGISWGENVYPPMPAPNVDFCIIKVDRSTILVTGGYENNVGTENTYFFDTSSKKWTKGPSLNGKRWRHACGMMFRLDEDSGKTERILVVAGGTNDAESLTSLSSVELFNLEAYLSGVAGGWEPGPDLPAVVQGTAIVEFQNGVIAAGGFEDSGEKFLYKLAPTSTQWEKLPQELKYKYLFQHMAFLIPDELADCA